MTPKNTKKTIRIVNCNPPGWMPTFSKLDTLCSEIDKLEDCYRAFRLYVAVHIVEGTQLNGYRIQP